MTTQKALPLVLILLFTGCGSQVPAAAPSVSCPLLIRFDQTLYEGAVNTDVQAKLEMGSADKAVCSDTGASPHGLGFEANPEQVMVWSFDGYDSTEVLGVPARRSAGEFTVYIAQSVSQDEVDRISRELANER